MIFSDQWFLLFTAAAFPLVWMSPQHIRLWVLLGSCLVFHAHYAGPAGMLPIFLIGALVFLVTSQVLSKKRVGMRSILPVATISIAALLFYKYAPLLNELTGSKIASPAAPLAISFFTFEFIHLLIERRKNSIREPISLLNFALFTLFFPSLAAGPVKRYDHFVSQLKNVSAPNWNEASMALGRIFLGYFQKFALADALAADLPINAIHWEGSISLLALMQGFRIYMDFSGYSNIAIGLGLLFRIKLPENFSFPYFSTNISEFWRRWHMSLSSWIRDYVYILLGGNRSGKIRTIFNLTLAMVVCGLWHGAAIHFVLWGLLHGIALVIHRLWTKQSLIQFPSWVSWGLTFSFVQLSWLIFFHDFDQVQWLLENREWF